MKIVCFGDGLGNQMFQYAFYLELQRRYPDEEILMDIFNIYGSHIHNGFELDRVFNVKKHECTSDDAKRLLDYCPIINNKYWLINKGYRIRNILGMKKDTMFYQKDATMFYPEVFMVAQGKSFLYRGNWVNEQYFSSIREEIACKFSFPPVEDDYNLNILEQMRYNNSVSIHIRGGDYIQSPLYSLSEEYYARAIRHIEEHIINPAYYIFTDDPEYVRKAFPMFQECIIVSGNQGMDSWIDMFLTSQCKHNIIANSTFSFWGAYLNQNKEKIVIAPAKSAPQFTNPFACDNWIMID